MNDLLKDFNITDYNKFDIYYKVLTEKNKVMNLTSITEYEDVYIKHFYDSLLITKCNMKEGSLIDIGSGAGFPGLVLAIQNEARPITLLEPTGKRARFLEEVASQLQLSNVTVINDRAENLKSTFMYATARAVAQLNILLELVIPLLEVGGYFYCMKGANYEEELLASTNAMQELNISLDAIYHFDLPLDKGKRSILVFKKLGKTKSIYPRRYAQILKQPL